MRLSILYPPSPHFSIPQKLKTDVYSEQPQIFTPPMTRVFLLISHVPSHFCVLVNIRYVIKSSNISLEHNLPNKFLSIERTKQLINLTVPILC